MSSSVLKMDYGLSGKQEDRAAGELGRVAESCYREAIR